MSSATNTVKELSSREKRALLAERLRQTAERPRIAPLSFAQQRLWFLDQLEPNSPLYNIATAVRIKGNLNAAALARSLQAIIARHESLRTRFACEGENPVQRIDPEAAIRLNVIDLSARPEAEREIESKSVIQQEVNKPFDLSQDLLVRATLLRLSANEHLFILIIHHIVADEWSLKIFFSELAVIYEAFVRGDSPKLEDLLIQYSEYASWQQKWLEGETLEKQLAFWRGRLDGNIPITRLPSDRAAGATPTFNGRNQSKLLGEGPQSNPDSGALNLAGRLNKLAEAEKSSLFMVVLAAFQALVYRYTQQEDVIIGSPIAGRNRFETERLIGFFVNTLPLRTKLNGNPAFRELLARVREVTLGAYANQDVPFDKLVEELHPERSLSHLPFTRLMFALQNGVQEKLEFGGLTLEFQEVESSTAKFDLTLVVQETSRGLLARAEYNTDLFSDATIERLLGHFEELVKGIAERPNQRLSELPLLTQAEQKQLLVEWNRTEAAYPRKKTVSEIFESQAKLLPEATAVVFGKNQVTYAELNSRANQVARYLKQFGVGPNIPVGICVERSVEMVVGVLGVLKAGGAYVPLDSSYPRERLAFMLEDSRAPVLFTQQRLLSQMPKAEAKVICLDSDWELIARQSKDNPVASAASEDLAYVMYTSGSTGQPKGVAVPHRAIVRLVMNTNYIRLDATDRIAQVSNFSFDAATFEIWGALLNGGKLIGITTDIALSPREFAEELREQEITGMFLTSALFNLVARESPEAFSTLRTMMAGGEALDPKWVRAVLKNKPPQRLVNGYGPTENTTFTCSHLIRELREDATNVPIGRPIANTQVFILDQHLNPVPIGVPGELYAAGDGLARGYWNRPERTASKFVPNPFAKICANSALRTSRHLYRTGDLARYLPGGEIEFLGRIDGQVKIRGFRIELGEIETILGRHPAVRDCVVRVCGHEAEKKRLAAYIVPSDGKPLNVSELRTFLKEKLPEHMLPSAFVSMDTLPLTPNGKVDRQALPEPDSARPEQDKRYVGPRDEIETKLTQIWEKVLGVHPVGIEDRFFDLGGHSLLAVRLMAQIEKAFGKKLRLATIFQKPTIEQLAEVIRDEARELSSNPASSLVGIQEKGTRPPLFLVHGAGGGMFWGYGNLSKRLGAEQPVYGFKSRGLDGRQELARIEEMAAAYVTDLRALQPEGPYYLGGYCFGGIVAYEIARQLTSKGQEVALLALMNCAPPNSRYTRVQFSSKWLGRFLKNLLYWAGYFKQWTPNQRREFFAWKLGRVKRKFGFSSKEDGAAEPSTRAEAIRELVDLSSFSGEERVLWEAHIRALLDYHPQPFFGKVHLFRSPGHPLWCSFDPDYGWRELAKGGVEIKIVPGAHEKILEEPCVQVVAAELEKLLRPTFPTQAVQGIAERSGKSDQGASLQPAASFAQQRLWFLNQLEPGASAYNYASAWRLKGELNFLALEKSLRDVIRRHEALRQSFSSENGSLAVQIRPEMPISPKVLDGAEAEVPHIISEEERQPFDLANDPLLRATLIRLNETEHVLALVSHEIAVDRASLETIIKEIVEIYPAFAFGKPVPSLSPRHKPSEFAHWQSQQTASTGWQQHREFWVNELKDAPALLELPTDYARPGKQSYKAATATRPIPSELMKRLSAFSARTGTDEFGAMLALLNVLIHRYGGQQDIVIGTSVLNGSSPNCSSNVGNFENLTLLRAQLSGTLNFEQVAGQVREKLDAAREHREFPFEKLLDELRPKPEQSYHPLCQIFFTCEAQGPTHLKAGSLEITPIQTRRNSSKFDLHFNVVRHAEGTELQITYATDLFNRERIDRMLSHFEVLLHRHLAEPSRPISQFSILTEAEEEQVIRQWNETQQPYPKDKTLVDLFSEQVARTPDAEALVCGDVRLSYRELYARATTLGDRLRALGVGKQTLVGLCLERSWEMVAGILGTLQAGAAYVPMDPAYPRDRLAMMLDDAQVRVLLTQEKLKGIFAETKAQILCVEDVDFTNAKLQTPPTSHQARPEDLAYVIYTSGSTGKPKGVALEHRNAVAFVCWAKEVFSPEELSGVLASTSICFDLSIFEMFVPLCWGGKVILAENALALPTIAAAHEVKLVNTVPSAMRELLRVKGVPPSVRVVNLAGEPLPALLVNDIYHETNVQKVYDLYGPTETTTYSTFTLRKPDETPTIGRPLANEQVYLLDQYKSPVPVGIPGEVYIGGDGVTRGYLNRPELTAEKFLPNPFRAGERVYRTGDLARWRPDGNLEFLGRIDNQVKIRGFRIELGEIESVLKKQPFVAEALVMARDSRTGDKRLVAYLARRTADGAQAKDAANPETAIAGLKRALREKLPEYMVPSAFVFLDAFPLTPNGKVDRKALPEPELAGAKAEQRLAPRTPTEEKIVAIWREVVGLKEVSVRDNFFDLGGHSLLAIRIVSRMREIFRSEVPLFGLFEAPTIEALAKEIDAGRWPKISGFEQTISTIPRDRPLEPSFVQERYWFLDQFEPGTHAYNVPQAIRIEGKLDVAALQKALDEVVRRHETLRTTLQQVDGSLKQVIAPNLSIEIPVTDLRPLNGGFSTNGHTDVEVARLVNAEAQQPFDLARGPLVRVRLIRIDEPSHALVVVMHHIISDGWSLPIFFRELAASYDAFAAEQNAPSLPALQVQYADYAHWQHQTMQGAVLEHELGYWKHQLAGAPAGLELPADNPELADKFPRAAQLRLRLSDKLSTGLNTLSQKNSGTPFMVLLSGLAITLHKWTGQKDLVLGTVVAGREKRELEGLIGCFVNFLPLRVVLNGTENFQKVFHQVKATVLEAQKHQDCPFEKIVEAINPERRLNQNPLYNVGLVVQNFSEQLFPSSQLQITRMPVEMQAPLLDLRFEVEQGAEGFSLMVEYKTEIFEQTTMTELLGSFHEVLAKLTEGNDVSLEQIRLTKGLEEQSTRTAQSHQKQTIAVAATFTAEPLEEPLRFWTEKLGLQAEVRFAPYNQVFQELLNSQGEFGKNQRGLNVVCLRLEDWQHTSTVGNGAANSSAEQSLKRNVDEFLAAIKTAAQHSAVPFLVCLCPPSLNATHLDLQARLENDLATELDTLSGVYVLRHEQASDWYPVTDYFDASTNELGHVPYTPIYFTALGTAIARKFHALNRPATKVIALDCDNTLWSGVCGEDGAAGVRLDAPRLALQKFIKQQHESGMLLCICSKNNEEDALEVFKQRLEMPLRREHIVAWRLNWLPKSENLKSLAEQLRLGLDSFIFIDDNPVECAEVEANCPGVLTLLLPEKVEAIPQFLKHCWVFDHLKLTREDRKRAQMYRQQEQREEFRAQSGSLGDFIAGLDLKVQIEPLTEQDLARAAQLTQRTNQFNCTTKRLTETELQQFWRPDAAMRSPLNQSSRLGELNDAGQTRVSTVSGTVLADVLTVSVRDRFGDYGLVGLMIYRVKEAALEAETFLLSCRVLGRGVEHRMLSYLGEVARGQKLNWVDVHFARTSKNKPALDFLESVAGHFRQPLNGGYMFRMPTGFAAEVTFHPDRTEQVKGRDNGNLDNARQGQPATGPQIGKFSSCRNIALEFNDPYAIHQRIEVKEAARSVSTSVYAPPRNELQRNLCAIWQKLLRVERVGITDNFFELGGHSLLAVRLFAEVERLTGRKLPLVTLFQSPTIEQLTHALAQGAAAESHSLLVPLQQNGSKPPLFLIHGAGGDVLWGYANLAAHMPADQPIYGIKSRGQVGLDEFNNLEEMAAYYLREVRAFQPKGPYCLGGYCFGGNVAYEMGRQLRAQGEDVTLIALLDTAPNHAGYEKARWWRPAFAYRFARNFYYWLEDFARLRSEERHRFVTRKTRAFLRKLQHRFTAGRDAESVDLEDIIDPQQFPQHELRLWQIHLQALIRHQDKPYPGHVTLFRTRGQPLICSFEEDFCWSKLAQGGLTLRRIQGSHENIFMEPNVRFLAKELEQCLGEAAQRVKSGPQPEPGKNT